MLISISPFQRRIAGWIAIVAPVLTFVAIGNHPVAAHSPVEIFTQIDRLAPMDRLVHGIVVAAMVALTGALAMLSAGFGLGRATQIVAVTAFAAGVLCTIVAATLDGFVIPDLATIYLNKPAEASTGIALLRFCAAFIVDLTKIGLGCIAGAIVLWSIDYVRAARGSVRAAGIFGFVSSAVAAGVLAFGGALTPHLLMGAIALQTAWYVFSGVLVLRGELDPPAA